MASGHRLKQHRLFALMGPAFIAAIAYVDPGNVAANITAGARYGYLLVWVLVLSNIAAMLVQYLSAKLGIVTGRSLPTLLGERLRPRNRILFWLQAELVAAATDLAEVIGGAIALNLLFGIPLLWSGVIIGAASIVILLPRFKGSDSILVAASMLGATVMPHAIYLHSSLVNDHHTDPEVEHPHKRALLRATRHDILWALSIAGIVNIGLLLLAASALSGAEGTDTIEGAYHAIAHALGPTVSTIFALGLLASGLASTSVGAYAGSEIMNGLLHVNVPLLARRLVTIIPALIILGMGAEPTWALVLSQVALSFGIPFAIVPLMRLTRSKEVMGEYANKPLTITVASVIAAAIILLNILLAYLTITGQG